MSSTYEMTNDSINLTALTVKGLENALHQDFNRVEFPDRMAWIALLLKKIPDTAVNFPMGKWATIQQIESQLDRCAEYAISKV